MKTTLIIVLLISINFSFAQLITIPESSDGVVTKKQSREERKEYKKNKKYIFILPKLNEHDDVRVLQAGADEDKMLRIIIPQNPFEGCVKEDQVTITCPDGEYKKNEGTFDGLRSIGKSIEDKSGEKNTTGPGGIEQ